MSKNPRVTLFDKELGHKLRYLRKYSSYTLEDLAAILGVSAQQILKYEKGINRISAKVLKDICVIYQIKADKLLFCDN